MPSNFRIGKKYTMEFASDGKEKNKPQESECKYWENETEKNKPHKICHIEKIYLTIGNTIESDVFKIYDRDDDRGPRNRDPKNPTANRDRDRDTTSELFPALFFA